jgi:hypothetical protein
LGAWIAAVTLLLATAALVAAFWQLLSQTQARLDEVTPAGRVVKIERQIDRLRQQIDELQRQGSVTPGNTPAPAPSPHPS